MPPKKKLKPVEGQKTLAAFMKTQAKPLENEMSGEEPEVSDKTEIEPLEGKKTKPKYVRHISDSWLKLNPWLVCENNVMFCNICRNAGKLGNSFTKGCSNFRKSAIDDHIRTSDHQLALRAPDQQANKKKSDEIVMTRKEKAIGQAAKAVHWLVDEDLPLAKFPSMMALLHEYNVQDIEELEKAGADVHYRSRSTAYGLLEVFAEQVDEEANAQLSGASFVAVMADETTDRTIKKRLGIYVRTVDDEMNARTRFLTNIQVEHGTGESITKEILEEMDKRAVSSEKIIALGSDGARAMTGNITGVTGLLHRQNPHIVNIHCVAHRLALCTSQAAESVQAMKDYQETLTSLFYYFKASACRSQDLAAIQEILESPKLKIKEVHSVRWLSFFIALETVFRSLDALLTYLGTERKNDPKAIGLKKKVATRKFISLSYILMDITPVVGALNLFFQNKEIDIGVIKVKVDRCLTTLDKLKEGEGTHRKLLKEDIMINEDGVQGTQFKGHHITGCSQLEVDAAERKFLESLIANIQARFPDTELISAFGVLGMRPISFLQEGANLDEWGNDQLGKLLDHFGETQVHRWTEDKKEFSKTSDPIIQKEAALVEWVELKSTVKAQMYPRDRFSDLWQMIAKFHKDSFPNLMKLGQIALALPVHTADVERGFSSQNNICTAKRNRIGVDTQNMLLKQRTEGQKERTPEYIQSIVKRWRKKERKLFRSHGRHGGSENAAAEAGGRRESVDEMAN